MCRPEMTIDWRTELAHSWPLLGEGDDAESKDLSAYVLPVDLSFGPVRICLDGFGFRHLLVPCAPRDSVWPDRRESVLRFDVRSYVFGGAADQYVDVMCTRPDLNDLFDDVVVDVLSEISGSDAPAALTAGVVARWRELFSTRGRVVLSRSAQLGLFGELSILERGYSLRRATANDWLGPLHAPHDFEFADVSLEVKTVGTSSQAVEIHGIDQLEPTAALPLYLVVVMVSEDEAGESLSEIVARIAAVVPDPAVFQSRLRSAGYAERDASQYGPRLAVDQYLVAKVEAGFPRLVRSSLTVGDLPKGVTDVSYFVDLDEIRDWSAQDGLTLEGVLGASA